jgi:hypothetical protein
MDCFTLLFYLIEAYIITKNVVLYTINRILEVPCIARTWNKVSAFFENLHNQCYHIHTEPIGPFISVSFVSSTVYEDTLLGHKFTENYITGPNGLFGHDFLDESNLYMNPITPAYKYPPISDSCPNFYLLDDHEKDQNEKLYNHSNLNSHIVDAKIYGDQVFPIMYMLKTTDDDIAEYTPNPHDFHSYMIVHFDKDADTAQICDKLCSTVHLRKPCRIRFLSVEYSHPNMKSRVSISVPENMFYVGNELLSSTFILRYLEYHLGETNYVFDDRYTLYVVTKTVDYIEMSYKQYIRLQGVNSYTVENFAMATAPAS